MMELRSVRKCFPKMRHPAVDSVTLSLNSGEILGLVGLNGAGKSTLIRMCAGVIRPLSGEILVDGIDMRKQKDVASRRVGWVSEAPSFDPGAKVEGLLRYFSGFHRIPSETTKQSTPQLLEEVGLEGVGNARFRDFSQGMKKRFALAVALIGNPEYLLLDEILNGLDPEGVIMIRNMILRRRSEGHAVLLSSHILSEVQQVADRVAVLDEGKLCGLITKEDMTRSSIARLRMTIANVDAAAIEYLNTMGSANVDDTTITLIDSKVGPDVIVADLVERGYKVTSLTNMRDNLEEMFLTMIEENKRD